MSAYLRYRWSCHRHPPCTVTEAPPELPHPLSGGVFCPISSSSQVVVGFWKPAGSVSASQGAARSEPALLVFLPMESRRRDRRWDLSHPHTGEVVWRGGLTSGDTELPTKSAGAVFNLIQR